MKEHFLTLFLAVTTGLTIFIFVLINQPRAVTVFSFDDLLFEHQTSHGNLVIDQQATGDLRLAFLTRGINGQSYAGSVYEIEPGDTTLLTLAANENIPFTTHALVSSNREISEVLVIEHGFPIAHRAHGKTTLSDEKVVFMVSSVDLTGRDALIVGIDESGATVVEFSLP